MGSLILLAWPETEVRATGSWYDRVFGRLGVQSKPGWYRSGHGGVLLLSDQGHARYFDFGRYDCPPGLGRVRDESSDPELKVSARELPEILSELSRNPATHGEGPLAAGILSGVDFDAALRWAKGLQAGGMIPYGHFSPRRMDCGRFMARFLAFGGPPPLTARLAALWARVWGPSPLFLARTLAGGGSRPTDPSERIASLDVLHGVSLFGVVLSDVPLFAFPVAAEIVPDLRPASVAARLLELFVRTKFFTLFSVLFGISFALLQERAATLGIPFARPYLRRMAALFLIGVLQTALAWHSVLLLYAAAGCLVLPLRGFRTRTLAAWAGALFVLGWALPAAAIRVMGPAELPMGAYWAAFEAGGYGSGTWAQVAVVRFREFAFLFMPATLALFGLRTLSMILLGMVLFRWGVFREPERLRASLSRLAAGGLALGLLLQTDSRAAQARWMGLYFGGFCLSMGYLGLLAALCLNPAWKARLKAVSLAGRMCLTNYVLFSIAGAWTFHPYGLGLFGKASYPQCAAISAALCLILGAASRAWLGRFRFGPLEWAVRAFSYRTLNLTLSGAPVKLAKGT